MGGHAGQRARGGTCLATERGTLRERLAIEDKKNASRLTKNEGSNGLPLFAEQEVGIFVTKRAPDLRGESEGGGRQGLQEGESGRWERGRGGARGSASGGFSW